MEVHYNNLMEREQLVAEYEAQGLVMLHDDFDTNWVKGTEPHGTLTFNEPTPPTDEELYLEQLDQEMNDIHEKAILALKNWDSLTLSQKDTIFKNLLKWALYKDNFLKFGTLGD